MLGSRPGDICGISAGERWIGTCEGTCCTGGETGDSITLGEGTGGGVGTPGEAFATPIGPTASMALNNSAADGPATALQQAFRNDVLIRTPFLSFLIGFFMSLTGYNYRHACYHLTVVHL